MRPEYFAVQLVGASMSVAGVACMAALPLPNYRWYNRLAVITLLGALTCSIVLADLWIHRPPDPIGYGLASLGWGGSLIAMLFITLRDLPDLYPNVTHARRRVFGVNLAPLGMMVQVIPALLGLVGARIW